MALAFILGAQLTINVPTEAVPHLLEACDSLVEQQHAKGDTTNEECALMLIRLGLKELVLKETQKTANEAVKTKRAEVAGDFPTPLRPAVCGDGGTDGGEDCDDGNTAEGDGCDAGCQTE